MTINFRGYIFDDAGDAVSGASVKLLDTGTTTQEGSTVTSDSNGLWNFDDVSETDAPFDVEITKGSSVRRIRWQDQISLKEIDVRNNAGNTTPAATFTNFTNNADNDVAYFRSLRGTGAANDEMFIRYYMDDAGGNAEEVARMTVKLNDATANSGDAQVTWGVLSGNSIVDALTISSSSSAALSIDFNQNAISFGSGADTDISLTFDADSADGVITWMEDEDYFKFSDEILMNSTEKILFGDTASFIHQSSDGVMTVDGEATIDLNASTAVLVSNDLKLNSDSAVLGFGADNDTTLTHTDGTGLTLNSTNKLTFGDTGTFIHQSSDGVLTITSDTTVDINGAVAFDGAITGATDITLSGELDAATLDLSSSADIAGDLVLSGGADGALQFTNAGENSIKIPDNQSSALIIEEANNAYITFNTTNSSEAITVAKATTFSVAATLATGSTIGNLTLANGSITDSGGALDFGNETLTTTGAVDFGAATVDSLAVSDANITNVGDIALDSISADGTDINVAVSDNSATAFTIKQGSDAYLIVDTANSSESVSIGTGISGTAITLGHSTSEVTVADNLTVTGTLTLGSNAVLIEAELEMLDGITAGTAAASKAVVLDSNKDIATIRNLTIDGVFTDGNYTFDTSGNVSGLGTVASGAITSSGVIKTDAVTDATSTTDGSLQTDGGLSVVKDAVFGDDVFLLSDSAVLNMGAGNDATLTHDGTTGLTIAAAPISIDATGELHLNSTTGDIKLQDGGTDQIAFDLDGTAGVVIMKPMVDSDDIVIQQYDGTEVLRIEDGAYLNVSNTTASSSATTGSAIFGGGIGVAADAYVGDDLYLITDSAVLGFGADKDTTLTHIDGSGLQLNSTNKILFNDTSQFIHGSSATVLTVGATDEISLGATAVTISSNLIQGAVGAAFALNGRRSSGSGSTIQFQDEGTLRGYMTRGSGKWVLAADATNTSILGTAQVTVVGDDIPCASFHRITGGGETGYITRYYALGSERGRSNWNDVSGTFTIATISDYRLKENDVAISDGLTKINQLRPIMFNWKDKPSVTRSGFFAHEVQAIIPEAATGTRDAVDSNGDMDPQGLDDSKIVPILVAAVKELAAKVAVLEG